MVDLLICNALPWGEKVPRDLAIAGGRFVAAGGAPARTIDAGGRLVVAGFVEPHVHLDKVGILRDTPVNRSGTLTEAIEILRDRKRRFTVDEVAARATRAIEQAVANGVTRLRSHVDVDSIAGLVGVQGVARARERTSDLADVQIVAFAQEGILRDPGTGALLEQAMEHGADVVGGMPFNEATQEESRRHIEIAFEIAKRHDADVDMHVDETDDPNARTLEMLADATVAHGWQGRVTAGHTCAMAGYPDDYAARVIAKVKAAEINVICNPATNLAIQGRGDPQPKRRGITRVGELLDAGVTLSFGQDNLDDVFYPFGRIDPLEVALLMAHAAHLTSPAQIDAVFGMSLGNAARIMRLPDYGFAPGALGDLVILDATSATAAIAQRADRLTVIKRGRVVAETKTTRQVHRGA